MHPVAVVLADEEHGVELLGNSVEQLAVGPLVLAPLAGGFVVLTFEVARDPACYLHLINCLAAYNCWATEAGFVSGSVYDGRLSYEERDHFDGRETYQSAPALYNLGTGDCADLVAARCAEPIVFRAGGEPHLGLSRIKPGGSRVYHAVVRYPDGTTEDPSSHLGMPTRAAAV